MRFLFVVALVIPACSTSHAPPEHVGPVRASAEVVPAGRWFHEDLDSSGCVDCPTPRFAVLVDQVPAHSPPGYPMRMLGSELGLDEGLVWVAAMFARSNDAALYAESLQARVVEIDVEHARADRLVVRVRRTTPGYAEQAVRDAYGDVSELQPICRVGAGQQSIVVDRGYDRGDVVRIPDAAPWIRIRCGDGDALVPAAATDFGLTVMRDGTEMQYAGGVCGSTYYTRRVAGQPDEHLETARCHGQPVGDRWGVCPSQTLEGCVSRVDTLMNEGDLRRATRVAAYACAQGSNPACRQRWEVDLARGVAPLAVLSRAVAYCDGSEPELCAHVDALLRNHSPNNIVGDQDPGNVARVGCERGIATWCAALEQSDICDQDGCG